MEKENLKKKERGRNKEDEEQRIRSKADNTTPTTKKEKSRRGFVLSMTKIPLRVRSRFYVIDRIGKDNFGNLS